MTRIVYSTCSIHKTEDESVVSRLLAYSRQHSSQFNGEKYAWVLEDRSNVLPKWERRGLPDPLSARDADKVIRCAPEDHTNGFFVACFKRVPLAELPSEAEDVEAEKPAAKSEKPTAKAEGGKAKKAQGKGEQSEQKKGEQKTEANGKSKKRPAEEVEPEAEEEEEEDERTEPAKAKKQKTAAQLERAKRKKKAQKAKAGR